MTIQIKIFSIPIPGGEQLNEEMNLFLRTKKVLQTESHVVSNNGGTFWCFCIRYLDGKSTTKTQKVDYRQILADDEFARFSALRKIRRQIAGDEGIPAYAVFTDAELADLSKLERISAENMKKIEGIGEKKVEKYGHFFCLKGENETGK